MSPLDLLARLEGWADAKLLEGNYDCGDYWLGYENGRDSAFEDLLEYMTKLKGEL